MRTRTHATPPAITALSIVAGLAASSQAAPIDWNQPLGGSFNDPANWLGGMLPGAADDAVFGLDGQSYAVNLEADATVGGVNVIADDLTLSLSGRRLTVDEAAPLGLRVSDGASLSISGPGELAAGALGFTSIWSVDASSVLTINAGADVLASNVTFDMLGTLTVTSGSRLIDQGGAGFFNFSGPATISDGASVNARNISAQSMSVIDASVGGEVVSIGGNTLIDASTLSAELDVFVSGTLTMRSAARIGGFFFPSNGITLSDYTTIKLFGGSGIDQPLESVGLPEGSRLLGEGIFSFEWIQNRGGTISPGFDDMADGSHFGTLDLGNASTLTQFDMGTVEIDIGGSNPGVNHDLILTGTVDPFFSPRLGGILDIDFLGFTPQLGDSFDVILFAQGVDWSMVDGFDTIAVSGLPANLSAIVQYLPSAVRVSIIPAPGTLALSVAGVLLVARRRRA